MIFLKNLLNDMLELLALKMWVDIEISIYLWIWFLFICVLLVVLLLIRKHKNKKIVANQKELIYNYDNIFYLLAKSQYEKELDKESIGGDPCIAAIKPILNCENPDYLSNRKVIKENIKKVEILLWDQIIGDDTWDREKVLYKQYQKNLLWKKIFNIFSWIIFLLIFWFILFLVF